jgi:hypothetical protein
MTLPAIDALAFSVNDPGDHVGGGHCAALPGNSRDDERVALVNQYAVALATLVATAEQSGDRRPLSRPILFTAHHLCEVALKAAILSKRATAPKIHSLRTLWDAAVDADCFTSLTEDERAWGAKFAANLGAVSGDGTPGRYADGVVSEGTLDSTWCCLNVTAVRSAATVFAGLCISEVTGGGRSEPAGAASSTV